MEFNEKEIDLLNSAYQVFVGRTHIFDVLKSPEYENTGMENWVQTELAVGLVDRDYEVSTEGKQARDCDLIVKNKSKGLEIGIEIRAFTSAWTNGFINAFKEHPKADLYLFLSPFDKSMFEQLESYFKKNDYVSKHRVFKNWFVMLVKKN